MLSVSGLDHIHLMSVVIFKFIPIPSKLVEVYGLILYRYLH